MALNMVVVGLMLASMWLATLSSWRLRNWRATVVLLASSTVVLAAGLLPSPTGGLLQGACWVGVLFFVAFAPERLSVISEAEASFVMGCAKLLKSIVELRGRVSKTEPAAYVAEFERIVDALDALHAPSGEWNDLRLDMVGELRRRLVVMRLGGLPQTEVVVRANAHWAEIEQRFARLTKTRARFWAGWPWSSSRPADR